MVWFTYGVLQKHDWKAWASAGPCRWGEAAELSILKRR